MWYDKGAGKCAFWTYLLPSSRLCCVLMFLIPGYQGLSKSASVPTGFSLPEHVVALG